MRFSVKLLLAVVLSVCLSVLAIPVATAFGQEKTEAVNEDQMNRIGYDLLRAKRVKDAIEVFKQNVADYPQSANTYDGLGEAYMVNGDRELAIKNYERSVQLAPGNTNGIEALKKLRENKQE